MSLCGQAMGGATLMEMVHIFILAEGLKSALVGRGSSLVPSFCQSCLNFDLTHLAVEFGAEVV